MTGIQYGFALLSMFMTGFVSGMTYVVFHNRRVVKRGGHCACACDKGCC